MPGFLNENAVCVSSMTQNMTHELSAFASTSPAGGEKCPVCLRRLRNSRLGKPENCDHYFCFTCIHEWAKVYNF